jgi:hypothetical protein
MVFGFNNYGFARGHLELHNVKIYIYPVIKCKIEMNRE